MPELFSHKVNEFFVPVTMTVVGFVLLAVFNYLLVPDDTRLDIFIVTQAAPLFMVYLWLSALIIDSIRISFSFPARIPGFIYSAHLILGTILLLTIQNVYQIFDYDIDNNIYVWLILEIISNILIGRFLLFNVKVSFESGVLLNLLRFLIGLLLFLAVDLSIAVI